MKDFQKTSAVRRFMQTKLFLVFLFLIILFFVYSMFTFASKLQDTRRNRQVAEKNVEELENSKIKLEEDIERLSTERGVEESIRNKFGLAEEGEQMILIVDREPETEIEIEPKSKFWNFFTNWWK